MIPSLNSASVQNGQGKYYSQLRDFQEKGFCTVAGIFDDNEIALLKSECERLWRLGAEQNISESNILSHRAGIDNRIKFDRLDPVTTLSPLFKELADDDRVTDLMASILGGRPTLFKSKLIFKHPGTTGYGLHQDFPYWDHMGIPADALVTFQISIDSAFKENGSLEMFPGLHRSVLRGPIDSPKDVDPSLVEFETSELIEGHAGDVCIFHSLTPHLSGDNRSKSKRRMLFLIYTTEEYRDRQRPYYDDALGESL